MFELRKSFHFEASHVLQHHDGKCARLHGHSYELTLVLRGRRLQRKGAQRNMVADFSDISAAVKPLVHSHLDHHHLNDTLATDSPTAEFIARWIYRALAPALPLLDEVELRETASAVVVYRPSARTRARFARPPPRAHPAVPAAKDAADPARAQAQRAAPAAADPRPLPRFDDDSSDESCSDSDRESDRESDLTPEPDIDSRRENCAARDIQRAACASPTRQPLPSGETIQSGVELGAPM